MTPCGRIVTGGRNIEEVGWEIFRLMLAIVSCLFIVGGIKRAELPDSGSCATAEEPRRPSPRAVKSAASGIYHSGTSIESSP